MRIYRCVYTYTNRMQKMSIPHLTVNCVVSSGIAWTYFTCGSRSKIGFFCSRALRRQSKRPIIYCVAVCYTLRNGGVIHYSDIRRVHAMRWHRPLSWPNNPTVFMRLSDAISQHHQRLADSLVAPKILFTQFGWMPQIQELRVANNAKSGSSWRVR